MSDSGRSGEATTPSEDASPRHVRVPKANLKRLSGSCDTCRRRKVKCDSQKSQGAPCTNCRAHNIPCTHDMPVQKPGIKN
ncbi:hypothetical protein BDZ89DRAFT_372617 [Hymenopellis radicata]|nr:hypothetical protein BDZ89DRAFT_372617 [Hymenopellis radicata]